MGAEFGDADAGAAARGDSSVNYWEMSEQARGFSDRAHELMRQHKCPPTPPAYELWFNYAAGLNTELMRVVDAGVADGSIHDPAFLRETHARFCGGGVLLQMEEIGTKLQQEAAKLGKALEQSGEETAGFGKALSDVAFHLNNGDTKKAKEIISRFAATANAIEAKHKMLGAALNASSQEAAALRGKMDAVRKESTTDALTGLANHRTFDERLQQAAREARADGGDFCVLLADIDNFKKFNDTWGTATGDHALRLVAQCVKANTKGRDTAARYGGQEFVILLPRTSVDNAAKLADHIRKTVESKMLVKSSDAGTRGSITVSFGIAKYRPGEPAVDAVTRAKQSLNQAKRAGRNRVVAESVDATAKAQRG